PMARNDGTALAGLRLCRITRRNGAARCLNRQSFLRRPSRRQEWCPLHPRAHENETPPAASAGRHKAIMNRRPEECPVGQAMLECGGLAAAFGVAALL